MWKADLKVCEILSIQPYLSATVSELRTVLGKVPLVAVDSHLSIRPPSNRLTVVDMTELVAPSTYWDRLRDMFDC